MPAAMNEGRREVITSPARVLPDDRSGGLLGPIESTNLVKMATSSRAMLQVEACVVGAVWVAMDRGYVASLLLLRIRDTSIPL